MVVATEAELLLLDEPTAGMGAMESTQTADIVKTLVGEHAVLVIDHDIDFVAQHNGHVVMLHQGRLLREGTLDAIRAAEEVAAINLGRPKCPTCRAEYRRVGTEGVRRGESRGAQKHKK